MQKKKRPQPAARPSNSTHSRRGEKRVLISKARHPRNFQKGVIWESALVKMLKPTFFEESLSLEGGFGKEACLFLFFSPYS